MIKLTVTSASAVFEPRTAATATTAFPGFRDGTAMTAHRPHGRRYRGRWYLYESVRQRKMEQTLSGEVKYIISLELTFAGLHAVRPSVINILAAKSSAALEPSAARSATTDSA